MEKIKQLFIKYFKDKTCQIHQDIKVKYKISEEVGDNKVIFLPRFIRTPFSRSYDEIATDHYLILGLIPEEACYLGIKYGLLNSKNKNCCKNRLKSYFFLSRTSGTYVINYENREGQICYFDNSNKQTYLDDPRKIAASDAIKFFDPTQAFYIGILAGIRASRNQTTTILLPAKIIRRHLRLLNLEKSISFL